MHADVGDLASQLKDFRRRKKCRINWKQQDIILEDIVLVLFLGIVLETRGKRSYWEPANMCWLCCYFSWFIFKQSKLLIKILGMVVGGSWLRGRALME